MGDVEDDSGSGRSRLIFVTVGTDHHPFDRLIDWVEGWDRPDDVELFVQHGACRVPQGITAAPFLSMAEMEDRFLTASAVVCAAGPGTVMAARRAGCQPIVVPRLRRLGEVVDDHQQAFAELLALEGLVATAYQEEELVELLDRAAVRPGSFRFTPDAAGVPSGVVRMGELIDDLLRGADRSSVGQGRGAVRRGGRRLARGSTG